MKKIDRSAFLYLESEDGDADFAQCGDCCFFNGQRCAILGTPVVKGASCGFFVDGPYDGTPIKKRVGAAEAGLAVENVRCENCAHLDGERCGLYDDLNRRMATAFDLDVSVSPKGCCNAFTPEGR